MSKHAKRPATGANLFSIPTLDDCLFHRCDDHEGVRQLNANELQTGSECGACLAEELTMLDTQLLLVLDGYADRLAYAARLKALLASARDRLELMAPGAGAEFRMDADGKA